MIYNKHIFQNGNVLDADQLNNLETDIMDYVNHSISMSSAEYFHYDFIHDASDEISKISGGFTVDNISDKGYLLQDYSSKLIFNYNIDIDDIKIIADVELSDLTAIVALGSKTYTGTRHSSCITFDFNNKKILFAKHDNDTTIQPTKITVDISSIIFQNDLRYYLEIGRKGRAVYAAVSNYRTGKRFEYVVDESTETLSKYDSNVGWLYDEPTISQVGGTQAFLRDIKCFVPTDVKVAFVGDSITEGWGVLYKDTWANKCCQYFGNSVNMGRSGARLFAHTLDQLTDLLPVIKPKYVVVTIGTNESTKTTAEHFSQLVDIIKSNKAIPVINYIFRKKSSIDSQVTYINGLIKDLHVYGARFDLATSVNNDLTQLQDANLFQDDQLHPNKQGNEVIYQRFITDAHFMNFCN